MVDEGMLRRIHCDRSREYLPRHGPRSAAPAWRPGAVPSRSSKSMSDSPKNTKFALALQLVAVVPDGTPRETAPQPQSERSDLEPVAPPPGAALWFDDPDTRYVLH